MKPLAECLLQSGVGFREFEAIAKLAFVETAFDKFGVRGRATNISRVAAMTGISRKETSRLRSRLLTEGGQETPATSPASLVLAGWYMDGDFLDGKGEPLDLPLEGSGASFVSLVKRYAGDLPAGAIRAELKRSNNIEETGQGTLRVLRRHFIPPEVMERLTTSLEMMLGGLTTTIAHNSRPGRTEEGHFERFVSTDRLKPAAVPRFRQVARLRAQQLLEDLDDWIAANDIPAGSVDMEPADRRVGLGVFYYEAPRRRQSAK